MKLIDLCNIHPPEPYDIYWCVMTSVPYGIFLGMSVVCAFHN